ncbi:MAG: hypothetical protein AB1750_11795 [Chloroflexota bacterium]
MENPINIPSAMPESPKKPGSKLWLWILLGVVACACLCLLAVFVIVLNDPTLLYLLDTHAPDINVQDGTFNGSVYTAPDGNFSCEFGPLMQGNFGQVLTAQKIPEKNLGTVFIYDDFGSQHGVDYFHPTPGSDWLKGLDNPETLRGNLEFMLTEILLPNRGPNASVTHREFLPGDILYVILYNTDASHLVSVSNGVSTVEDYQEGYYIFYSGEWIYLVYKYITVSAIDEAWSPADLQSRVDEFYRRCQFQK